LSTIYQSILQCTNYCCDTTNPRPIIPLSRIGCFVSAVAEFCIHTIGCFADLRQHLTPSILANFQTETSKRRQIPTTNACTNFSFRGLRKKKNFALFRSFREYFRHAQRNYFRHADKLHTSQQRYRATQYAHTCDFTMAFGSYRAVPGINCVLCSSITAN